MMPVKRILIMGLPGSGKTTLAQTLLAELTSAAFTVEWLNADAIRAAHNDWDFSEAGRLRQAQRMRSLADDSPAHLVIADFVAPLPEMRDIFSPDITVWMNTLTESRFADTNRVFIPPTTPHQPPTMWVVPEQRADIWAPRLADSLIQMRTFNPQHPTVQLLGRYQPWHPGHRALFEKALTKTGQVCILVRECPPSSSNPFPFDIVRHEIDRDLSPRYQGTYRILSVPNITNITYGRDVGYTITQETLPPEIEQISATQIRAQQRPQV